MSLLGYEGRLYKRPLTEHEARRFRCPEDRGMYAQVFLWDKKIKGFGLCAQRGGKKTWIIQYTSPFHYTVRKRMKIGDYPQMTVKDARKKALELLGRVQAGECPASDRSALRTGKPPGPRPGKRPPTHARTVQDLIEAYFAAGAPDRTGRRKSEATSYVDHSRMTRDVVSRIGSRALVTMRWQSLGILANDLEKDDRDAARIMRIFRGILSWGVSNGWLLPHQIVRPEDEAD